MLQQPAGAQHILASIVNATETHHRGGLRRAEYDIPKSSVPVKSRDYFSSL
jgi:hypothetical protein